MEKTAEEQALERGWKPLEEFHGDEADWVDAETFMNRSKRERLQGEEIRELKSVIEDGREMLKGMRERAKKEAEDEVRAEMEQAFQDGDEEKFNESFKKLQGDGKPFSSPEDIRVQENWLSENPMYQRVDVGESARGISARILNRTPGLGLQALLEETHKEVSKIYPEYFSNTERQKPPAVEGGGQRTGGAPTGLTKEQKEQRDAFAEKQARYGFYKGKTGEGFEADYKAAQKEWEAQNRRVG